MAQRNDSGPMEASGLSTSVDYHGSSYHVQTQFSTRDAPVIESLVFKGGQTLVRITSSYDEVAREVGFTGEDGRHLLALLHDDLIRKIRHGMLRDEKDEEGGDPAALASGPPRLVSPDGMTADPAEVDDPGVRELLQELGVAIDRAMPEPAPRPQQRPTGHVRATVPGRSPAPLRLPAPTRPPAHAPTRAASATVPWWRRIAISVSIRLPF